MKKIFDEHSANKQSEDSLLTKIQRVTRYALFWNFWEATVSQILQIGTQTLLFLHINKILFGLQGTFFALVFGIVHVANLGLEFAIIPYFPYFSSSKHHFKKFFYHYLIPQFFIFLSIPFFIFYLLPPSWISHIIMPLRASKGMITIAWICIVSEGIKKNARAILYLAFKNKVTAVTEIIHYVGYSCCLWSMYLLHYPFSLHTLIIPFCILSLITMIMLVLKVYALYCLLPDHADEVMHYSFKKFNKNRLFIFINHACRIIFSDNFLITFFAQTKGLIEAGTAHLMSSITFGMTYCVQRLFAPTGGALFSHIRAIDHRLSQTIFSQLVRRITYTLIVLTVLLLLGIVIIVTTQNTAWRSTIIPYLIIFFLSHIIESLFMIFEKIYIAYEQPLYITACNLLSVIACYILYLLLFKKTLIYFVIGSMIIRMITFIVLCGIAFKKWGFSITTKQT